MIRRCISFLVLVGLVISQMATIHHAHAGLSSNEREQHDATPHFHCALLGHQHHHDGHSHDDDFHQHEDSDTPAEESHDNSLPADHIDFPHDATAVFCLEITATALGHEAALKLGQCNASPDLATNPHILDLAWGGNVLKRERPPKDGVDGSKIYLSLRHLRI